VSSPALRPPRLLPTTRRSRRPGCDRHACCRSVAFRRATSRRALTCPRKSACEQAYYPSRQRTGELPSSPGTIAIDPAIAASAASRQTKTINEAVKASPNGHRSCDAAILVPVIEERALIDVEPARRRSKQYQTRKRWTGYLVEFAIWRLDPKSRPMTVIGTTS